ncbi:MAG: hypothetical protein NTZ78_11315 [Candidatus Aureabacteria bacterium]|nr:hypothetical protein [Candidatus Auribacterota bacterium]
MAIGEELWHGRVGGTAEFLTAGLKIVLEDDFDCFMVVDLLEAWGGRGRYYTVRFTT